MSEREERLGLVDLVAAVTNIDPLSRQCHEPRVVYIEYMNADLVVQNSSIYFTPGAV